MSAPGKSELLASLSPSFSTLGVSGTNKSIKLSPARARFGFMCIYWCDIAEHFSLCICIFYSWQLICLCHIFMCRVTNRFWIRCIKAASPLTAHSLPFKKNTFASFMRIFHAVLYCFHFILLNSSPILYDHKKKNIILVSFFFFCFCLFLQYVFAFYFCWTIFLLIYF